MGGRELTVQYKPTRENPEPSPEKVMVRELAVADYPRLVAAIASEEAQVELYCDKPAGWAKRLTKASHRELITVGEEINQDDFFAWYERAAARTKKLNGNQLETATRAIVKEAIEKAVGQLGSMNGSPMSPSPAV